jgi:peptide deformylase
MATRPAGRVCDIRVYGDPLLRRKAARISGLEPDLPRLIADLVETMLKKDGLGLAANQIGELRAVIAVNPRGVGIDQNPLVLVNPEVVASSGRVEREEACLSLPGISEVLARPARVTVKCQEPSGTALEVKAEGTLARALLHEIDHLNGVLFIDHLPPVRRRMLASRLKALERRSCA